jgi:epoxyqueuosine reductase
MTLSNELIAKLRSGGAALVGFGRLDEIPAADREDLPAGIAIAVAYAPAIIAGITEGPTREYYDAYRRANETLNDLSAAAVAFLQEHGYRAVRQLATDAGIDPSTHSTRLPHKTVATRAGLGWIGKCALLVTEEYGSAIRITSVLTDAPLPVAVPVNHSRCGECRLCVEACPGHAPFGGGWRLGVHRDTFFNAWMCREAARAIAKARTGIEDTFCGICIAACPFTLRYVHG